MSSDCRKQLRFSPQVCVLFVHVIHPVCSCCLLPLHPCVRPYLGSCPQKLALQMVYHRRYAITLLIAWVALAGKQHSCITHLVHGWNGGKGCRGGVSGGPPPVGSLTGPPQAVQVCTLHHQPAGPSPAPFPTSLTILHSTQERESGHGSASDQHPCEHDLACPVSIWVVNCQILYVLAVLHVSLLACNNMLLSLAACCPCQYYP